METFQETGICVRLKGREAEKLTFFLYHRFSWNKKDLNFM
jgi:hypothetical protein